jgi:hypothetical protein
VKLTDLLRWGAKKDVASAGAYEAVKDRRNAPRRPTHGGGWIHWATESGEVSRARVTFVDVSPDPGGLSFLTPKPPPNGSLCWALPDSRAALPFEVRHVEKADQGCRVGGNLDFEERYVDGRGVSRVQWVSQGVLQTTPAVVKNSGQGLIEINLAVNIPTRQLLYLEGPRYGCLAVCRGARADGSRFILVAEAASDSFATSAAA